MKDIQLGDDGDMVFEPQTGSMTVVEGDDQISQKIQLALGTNLSELEWDVDFGLSHADVMDNSWDKSYLQTIIDNYLTETFEEVADSTITNYVYNKEQRRLTLYITVELSDGQKLTLTTGIGGDDNAGN